MSSTEAANTGNSNLEKSGIQTPQISPASAPAETTTEILTEVTLTKEVIDSLEIPREMPTGSAQASMQATSQTSTGDDTTAATAGTSAAVTLSQQKMIRGIKKSLNKEIRSLQRQADKISSKAASGKAHELNSIMAQIRKLQEIISHLAHATAEYIKKLYSQLFRSKNAATTQ